MTTGTASKFPSAEDVARVAGALEQAITESGRNLVDLASESPVLLVFLRHAGCTFCREAAGDIAKVRREIESAGTRIVLVHMKDREAMEKVVRRYGLEGLERICDSAQRLYDAFGLKRGSLSQLFGLKVWFRGLAASFIGGHGLSLPKADPTQMPGVFFLDDGMVARAFRHRTAADRPSYVALCRRDNA